VTGPDEKKPGKGENKTSPKGAVEGNLCGTMGGVPGRGGGGSSEEGNNVKSREQKAGYTQFRFVMRKKICQKGEKAGERTLPNA